MARRLVFFLVRTEDSICLEVSETLLDCIVKRRQLGLTRENSHITSEWVDCGGQTR